MIHKKKSYRATISVHMENLQCLAVQGTTASWYHGGPIEHPRKSIEYQSNNIPRGLMGSSIEPLL